MSSTRAARKILVTLPDAAWPLDGGKRLRCNGVLRGLAAIGEVDVVVLFSAVLPELPAIPPDVPVRRSIRLHPAPHSRVRGALKSLIHGLPAHVGAQRWRLVRDQLESWLDREYDLAWFGGLDHAHALHGLPRTARTIVDCDDVETEKWRAYLRSGGGGGVERLQRRIELPLWARLQRQAERRAAAVVVCSELDARRFGGRRTIVVPNTYPEPDRPASTRRAERASRADAPPRLLMIANWTTDQNVDAAQHAVHDVLPHVRRLLPEARLRLVGRGADLIAGHGSRDGVDVVGAVDDVGAELAEASVVVVPMRFGGGTRLKVLEALAHGIPVVSTPLGCEGTRTHDGVHLLVRERPEDFAAGVRDVVTDPELGSRLSAHGRALYEKHFRPQVAADAITALANRLLARDDAFEGVR